MDDNTFVIMLKKVYPNHYESLVDNFEKVINDAKPKKRRKK